MILIKWLRFKSSWLKVRSCIVIILNKPKLTNFWSKSFSTSSIFLAIYEMGPKAKTEDKKPAEEKSSETNKDELEPDEDDENKAKNKKIPEVQALEGEHIKR